MTQLKAGHCSRCHKPVWRIAVAQREQTGQGIRAGDPFLLWPMPDSLYARFPYLGGIAPGVAFCARCAPPPGAPIGAGPVPEALVLDYEIARGRYAAWFAPGKRVFYAAWLKDALGYTDLEVNDFLKLWDEDRG